LKSLKVMESLEWVPGSNQKIKEIQGGKVEGKRGGIGRLQAITKDL